MQQFGALLKLNLLRGLNLLKLFVWMDGGFTDKQREQEPPIGKIITVKANDLIDKRESDVYSLFLPIYVETRLDKSEADAIERIQSIFLSAKGMK